MSTYLITGIAGFIGSSLARAILEQGDNVRGVDNFSTGKRNNIAELLDRIDVREADLLDLEAMQSQQNALNHETAYATVTLTIIGPKAAVKPKPKPAPPPGLVNGLAGGWHALRVAVSWLLAIIGAVAPFAAVVAVAGVAALWVRRRLAARASRPADGAGSAGSADG